MTADRRTDRRARHRAGGRAQGAGRAAGPVSHRRRPAFRGRRPLLATLLSAFFLVGVCAATGIAWDPGDAGSVQGAVAPGDLPVATGTGGSHSKQQARMLLGTAVCESPDTESSEGAPSAAWARAAGVPLRRPVQPTQASRVRCLHCNFG